MFFTARSTSSVTQSSTTGFQTPSIMKTSRQQTSQSGKDKSTFSREASLASLSAQQGSDLERTMTATSGQRCYESSGRYSPLSSLVRTLLVSSRWYSPAKRLRWEAQPLSSTRTTTFTKKNRSLSLKQSAQTLSVKDTPSSRLLFRLVPSVHPTSETECGSSQEGMFPHLLLTPCTREFCEDPASMRARAKRNGYKNGTKYNSLLSQVVYSDILPTPVTQGLKVCENGKQRFLSLGLLPTPLAVEIQHSKRIKALKEKGGKTMGSRANGEQRPNGLMDFINFHGILPTPNASEATKWATTYNPDSQMGSGLTAMAINGMLPTPSAADATMGAVLGKNDRIVQTPSGTLRKVTPTTNFSLGLARTVQLLPTPCAQDFKKRGVNSKQKGLPEMFRKCDWLLTPSASDGMRAMMTMDNLKAHRKKNAAQSNLAEQIAHKIGGGTSQLSPLFVEEMMGYPLIYLVLPFLSQDGDRSQ